MAETLRGKVTGQYAVRALDRVEATAFDMVKGLLVAANSPSPERMLELVSGCEEIVKLIHATRTGDYRGLGLDHPDDFLAA